MLKLLIILLFVYQVTATTNVTNVNIDTSDVHVGFKKQYNVTFKTSKGLFFIVNETVSIDYNAIGHAKISFLPFAPLKKPIINNNTRRRENVTKLEAGQTGYITLNLKSKKDKYLGTMQVKLDLDDTGRPRSKMMVMKDYKNDNGTQKQINGASSTSVNGTDSTSNSTSNNNSTTSIPSSVNPGTQPLSSPSPDKSSNGGSDNPNKNKNKAHALSSSLSFAGLVSMGAAAILLL